MQSIWQLYHQYSETILGVAWHIVLIVLFFLAAKILVRIGISAVHRMTQSNRMRLDERRQKTMRSLLDNLIRYTVYFIFVVEVLSSVNIHVETLLAGAGIVGLAVGFGAQSLIKDVLTGFFILFEDQYGVGDYVKINQFTGTVLTIGLRLTRVQAWTGEIEIIPNGQITQVTNYSKANSLAVVDISVNRSDLRKAMEVIEKTMASIKESDTRLVGDVTMLGVQAVEQNHVVVRVTAVCEPTMNWGVQREAYQKILEAFAEAGIDSPRTQHAILVENGVKAAAAENL